MNMRTLFAAAALAPALIAPALASEGWFSNLDEAKKQAKAEGKLIFLEFTGSDWCGPCIQFKSQVLSRADFLESAQKDFVLVELDYPRRKEIDVAQKEHNETVKNQYAITGFPTILLLNAEGEIVGGFVGGIAYEKLMENLSTARENQQALASFGSMNDEEKLQALIKLHAGFDSRLFEARQAELAAQIKALDPEDKSGFAAQQAHERSMNERQEAARQELSAFMMESMAPRRNCKTIAEIIAILESEWAKMELSPEARQCYATLNSHVYITAGQLDKAEAFLQEAIDLAPHTNTASRLKYTLTEMKQKRPEAEKKLQRGEHGPQGELRPAGHMAPMSR